MHPATSTAQSTRKDGAFQKWGCLIFILAAGAVQAVHYAINLGLVGVPFWLFDKARRSTQNRLWLRAAGVALALPLSLIALSCQFGPPGTGLGQTPEAQASATLTMRSYSSPDADISFQYPEFMTIGTDTRENVDLSGVIVTMESVVITSTDPRLTLMVITIADPLHNTIYPTVYPPSEDALRRFAVTAVTLLNNPSTERDQAAVEAVYQGATITTISGHDAAVYRLGLEGMPVGHVYVVGAIVITETRDVSLYLIGSDEPGLSRSVQPSYVDDLWSRFVASVKIAY